jgi:TolB-like protein
MAKNSMNPRSHIYSCYSKLIIISVCALIISIGCSTTPSQNKEAISDLPDSQEIKLLPKDVKAQIALFPFENFSVDANALNDIMPLVKNYLESKGFAVLDEDKMENFLLKERIRSTGYISEEMAGKLGKELHVDAILVGSINTFSRGENPRVGLSARLIRSSDGTILWTNHAAATGDDFTGILGLGTIRSIDKLSHKMTNKLLESFSIIPPYKEKESMYSIAVMPFKNESKIRGAGMIAMYMFIAELNKNKKFEPITYGDVRELIVKLRVRSKGELDFKNIGSIAESSGVDGILIGTVERYSEEQGGVPPEASISARLIEARTGRILWYNGYEYRGDEGISIFDWGRVRSAESVAYEVVSKLVRDLRKVKWQ